MNAKSKMKVLHNESAIEMNKIFAKMVENPFSEEYAFLQKIRQDYPQYKVRIREIKKNPNKETYADPMTNAFIQMSGVFAELELRIIRERVRSGMANAKAKGAKIGRPQATADDIPANFLRHYPAFKNKQLNVSELARVCDLSRTTVYKYIGLLEG